MTGLPENPSESFKARNPHLYPVRAVQAKVTKPDQGSEGQNPELEAGETGVEKFRVTLIVLSKRRMDSHDNLPFSLKPIVDAITQSLGCHDDSKIEWEYAQAITSGQQGVVVKIEATAG